MPTSSELAQYRLLMQLQNQQNRIQFPTLTPNSNGAGVNFLQGLSGGLGYGIQNRQQQRSVDQINQMMEKQAAAEQAAAQAEYQNNLAIARQYNLPPELATSPAFKQIVQDAGKYSVDKFAADKVEQDYINRFGPPQQQQSIPMQPQAMDATPYLADYGPAPVDPTMPMMAPPQPIQPLAARNMGGGVMMEQDPSMMRQPMQPLQGGVANATQNTYGAVSPDQMAWLIAHGGSGAAPLLKTFAEEQANKRLAEQVGGLNPANATQANQFQLYAGFQPQTQEAINLPGQRFQETKRHNLKSESLGFGNLGVSQGQLGVAQGNLSQRRTMDKWRMANPEYGPVIINGAGGGGGLIPRKPGLL